MREALRCYGGNVRELLGESRHLQKEREALGNLEIIQRCEGTVKI